MGKLDYDTIIECINFIISKNEYGVEEKIEFPSGGSITFYLKKLQVFTNNSLVLRKIYIKVVCKL